MDKQTPERIAKDNEQTRCRNKRSRTLLYKNRTVPERASARIASNELRQASKDRMSAQERKRRNVQDAVQMRSGRNEEEINKRLKSEQTDEDDLTPYIKFAVEQAMRHIHCTKNVDNREPYHANVCVCCERFIPSTDPRRGISISELRKCKSRLGVKEYEAYHKVKLHEAFKKQYRVNGLPGLFLSPQAKQVPGGLLICESCKQSL